MMQAIPTNWFSWSFELRDGDKHIADLQMSSWRERGQMRLGGQDHELYREGWMSGTFILKRAGLTLARAEKLSVFQRAFDIRHADRDYRLVPSSAFRREMLLLAGSRVIRFQGVRLPVICLTPPIQYKYGMWEIYEHRRVSGRIVRLPTEVLKRYEKWKDIVHLSGPEGLRLIKGFRDEALQGDWQGHRSSRLGIQYRVIYRVVRREILVEVVDLTAHDYRRK